MSGVKAVRRLTAKDFVDQSRETIDIEIPKLGGIVTLRELTPLELKEFATSEVNLVSSRLVAMCAVDESGNRIFTADQLDSLGAAMVLKLYRAARKLNGLDVSPDEAAALKKD